MRWQEAGHAVTIATLEDGGEAVITRVRLNRGSLISGLFYGVEGMRVGERRRLEVAPHLGYGATSPFSKFAISELRHVRRLKVVSFAA